MRAIIKILVPFLFIITLQSCIRDADVEVPEVDPKLVIFSAISPQDDFVLIGVSKSKPFFGTQEEDDEQPILDAIVRLWSATDTIVVPYVEEQYAYYVSQLDFPIVAGETYYMEVAVSGLPTVYASTTVPLATPSVSSATFEGYQSFQGGEFSESTNEYRYNVQWMDSDLNENYYRVILYWLENIDYLARADEYVKDVLDNGEEISKNLYLSSYGPDISGEGIPYAVYLLNVDETYYRYHKTSSLISGDDPFSEPVQVYTNVENGLGCFCSFNGSYEEF